MAALNEALLVAIQALVDVIVAASDQVKLPIPPYEPGGADWQQRLNQNQRDCQLHNLAVSRLSAASRALACLTSNDGK